MKEFFYRIATDQINGFLAGILKIILWLFSLLFFIAVSVRSVLYRSGSFQSFKLPKPVISVGNMTLGGVGKTPFVIYLSEHLLKQNKKAAILTRGYMSEDVAGDADEVAILKEKIGNVPVLVGADRKRNALEHIKNNPVDVFLLDDGFQHWRLKRDIDIVLIDAVNPWGNKQLLPRGILREPLEALRRAQAIVLTRVDLAKNLDHLRSEIKKINSSVLIAEAAHQPVGIKDLRGGTSLDLKMLKGQKICSFSSIGNPGAFVQTLVKLEAAVVKNFSFMDHHVYQKNDLLEVVDCCSKQNIKTVVTTQKDAVKLRSLLNVFGSGVNICYLEIEIAVLRNEKELLERIAHLS